MDLVKLTLTDIINQFTISEIVWDDLLVGKIMFEIFEDRDLRAVKINRKCLELNGGALKIGDLLCESMPAHKDVPFPCDKSLIEIYLDVARSRESKFVEFKYEGENIVGWFRAFVVSISPSLLYISFVDISDIKETAYKDSLTNLYNRRILERPKAWQNAIFIDLDRFKTVNDRRGHAVGDKVLIAVAKELQAIALACQGWAIRQGGDEFLLLFNNANPLEIAIVAFNAICRVDIQGSKVGASLGVASNIGLPDILINAAELASRESKKNKVSEQPRDRITFWNELLSAEQSEKILIEESLSREIGEELFLVYQPIVSMEDGGIVGAEALIRWKSPLLGFVSPEKFIPIAEKNITIYKISKWVMETAARQMQQWIKYDPNFSVSINISPMEIEDLNFVPNLLELIESFGLETKNLGIEVTERGIASNPQGFAKAIAKLQSAFIQLKVDDFGTGQSGLERLLGAEYDVVKVDKCLIPNSSQDNARISICQAIHTLSIGLGFVLIAEGVETEEQKNILIALGYQYGQGYFFAKPMSADEFEARYFAEKTLDLVQKE